MASDEAQLTSKERATAPRRQARRPYWALTVIGIGAILGFCYWAELVLAVMLVSVLLAFILTLAGTRFYTRMARVRGWGSAIVGDVHVHHLVPGVVLSLVAGGLALALEPREFWVAILAAAFGAGAALVLDMSGLEYVSSAGLRGNFGQSNYGAAKAGLMGLTFVIAVEFMKGNAEGKYSITANALAPAGMTRMVGTIPGMEGRPVPPEMNPDLNGPIVAFLASDQAAHVNGQVFGRRGYAYTLFQTPKPLAALYKEGGMTAEDVARNFDAAFAEHLSVPGIPQTAAMKQAQAAAAKK